MDTRPSGANSEFRSKVSCAGVRRGVLSVISRRECSFSLQRLGLHVLYTPSLKILKQLAIIIGSGTRRDLSAALPLLGVAGCAQDYGYYGKGKAPPPKVVTKG
jgi:hypothetical protein